MDKINLENFFNDYPNDGNALSFNQRVDEVVKFVEFPVELTGLKTVVNNEQELRTVINEQLKK